MNDRELLEMAAKAAGFGAPGSGAVCWTESEYPHRSGLHGALWNYVGHMDSAELWNPLTDDGDAFRLASAMGMTVEFGNNVVLHPGDVGGDGTDPLKATRQAIVKAAAEIGKAMP